MRFFLVAVLAHVALAAPQGLSLPQLDGRIVGGVPTEIEDHPYQVSLQGFSHSCGASIISKTHVVTAAHCTYGRTASQLSIRAGSTYHQKGGQKIQVKTIYQHPQFSMGTIDYDVSVLELEEPLEFGPGVQKINLAQVQPSKGDVAQVSGWGVTNAGGIPAQLQTVQIKIVSKESCRDAYGKSSITDRMICAAVNGGGKDSCQGDSGGPLVSNGELVGIVSWGKGCGLPSYPGVYTDVSSVIDYIIEKANL